jgi:hypothetical protein
LKHIVIATTGLAFTQAVGGDYSGNQTVDAGDYVSWRKTFGQTVAAAYAGPDGNGDSVVNEADYEVWRSHFGQSKASGEGTGLQDESALTNSSEPAVPMAANEAAFSQLHTAPLATSIAPLSRRRLRSSAMLSSFTANHLLDDLLLSKSSRPLKSVDAFYQTRDSAADDKICAIEIEAVDDAFTELCGAFRTEV